MTKKEAIALNLSMRRLTVGSRPDECNDRQLVTCAVLRCAVHDVSAVYACAMLCSTLSPDTTRLFLPPPSRLVSVIVSYPSSAFSENNRKFRAQVLLS